MTSPSLGWQSWSPPIPHPLRLPRRDYLPANLPPFTLPSSKPAQPLSYTYWCSWYALGWHLTPSNLLAQAMLIKKSQLPIDYFLIDDGWRQSWLPALVPQLRALKFKIGLWYAPYTRHRSLPLYPTLKRLITDYQLDLLKLDFLYYPYFHPRLYPDPARTLHNLFTHLTQSYPHLTTIACGTPFTQAIGRVSCIRVSKDTAFPPYLPRWLSRSIYSHRVRLLSQKFQAWQHDKSFIPDPDVRMFSLDTTTTSQIWDNLPLSIKGLGDNLTRLTSIQLQQARNWLS